LQGI
jgi:hypothetical protein